MPTLIRSAVVFAFVLAVPTAADAAARWGPTWSEVTGDLYSRMDKNRSAATIKQIDGKHETKRIVKAEPGRHEVVVASPMRKGFHGSDATLDVTLDPCKRYYINAQFDSGTGPDWRPVVAMAEPIAGCKVP